uniref:NADH-ubiquinone oxidoreductase chain 6 n=1 Tax=Scotoplanes sp. H5 TaxID=2302361 RepID=A0A3G9GQN4_9ECHN|nr:NADH dehydrogenase subunit 6 [Scotoplanes sp. H5]
MLFYNLFLFLLLGSILVFYSFSPYYAALGLVITSLVGCIILALFGLTFIALLFLLIYLGGMLIVFVYSSALSADQYPVVSNLSEILILFLILSSWLFIVYNNFIEGIIYNNVLINSNDLVSLGLFYSNGGIYLLLSGFALLVTLVVALIISSGVNNINLRHI